MDTSEIVLHGIGASPGICIGKAYIVDKEGVNIIRRYYISENEVQKEKNRFKAAAKKAEEELKDIIARTPEDLKKHANILQTHLILVKDKMLYGKTIEIIETNKVNAEWALKTVVGSIKSVFKEMTDSYFKERANDIIHVSDRIMRNLMGIESVDIKTIDKRVILVATDLSPAETSQIQLEKIKGFVTDSGGMTSHTGIVARSLQIPAVLGLVQATELIANDDIIIVDGTNGIVIIHPTEQTLIEYNELQQKYETMRTFLTRDCKIPALTQDGIQIQIMGNIEHPEDVVSVKDNGGDGIGLYRTEFQYLRKTTFPIEVELFEKYREVAEIMAPKPVTIRTLDINGDKAINYIETPEDINPVLGLRAIRYCLKRPDVFKTQLRAILKASVYGNIRILFPMITSYDELKEAKAILNQTIEELEKEHISINKTTELGIMIEVPSAVITADDLAQEVNFFSIGTNDLIQYTLAIDRTNNQVAYLYDPLHPAILRMIKQICDVAKMHSIKVFMCGEMANNPLYVPILIGMGIQELSMNPQSIPLVKRMVRSLTLKDIAPVIDSILVQKSSKIIQEILRDAYGSILSEKVYME